MTEQPPPVDAATTPAGPPAHSVAPLAVRAGPDRSAGGNDPTSVIAIVSPDKAGGLVAVALISVD